MATAGSAQSTSARAPIIMAPTRTRAGAVAAVGDGLYERREEQRATGNSTPTTMLVRPGPGSRRGHDDGGSLLKSDWADPAVAIPRF